MNPHPFQDWPYHPADVKRPIEWIARHDRIVVVAALGVVVVLAWGLLLAGTGEYMPDARGGEHAGFAFAPLLSSGRSHWNPTRTTMRG